MDHNRLNFNDPTWNASERQELHQQWVERYRNNAPTMSPLSKQDGFLRTTDRSPADSSVGFFDATHERRLLERQGMEPLDAYNQTNQAYKDRQDHLQQTLHYAEKGPDRERLELLKNAEQHAWSAQVDDFSNHRWIPLNKSQETTPKHQLARESFAKLVESDRAHGHPITDLSRDFEKEPVTRHEQYRWSTRETQGLSYQKMGVGRPETREESSTWHMDKPRRGENPDQPPLVPADLQQRVEQRQQQEAAQRSPVPAQPSKDSFASQNPPVVLSRPNISNRIQNLRAKFSTSNVDSAKPTPESLYGQDEKSTPASASRDIRPIEPEKLSERFEVKPQEEKNPPKVEEPAPEKEKKSQPIDPNSIVVQPPSSLVKAPAPLDRSPSGDSNPQPQPSLPEHQQGMEKQGLTAPSPYAQQSPPEQEQGPEAQELPPPSPYAQQVQPEQEQGPEIQEAATPHQEPAPAQHPSQNQEQAFATMAQAPDNVQPQNAPSPYAASSTPAPEASSPNDQNVQPRDVNTPDAAPAAVEQSPEPASAAPSPYAAEPEPAAQEPERDQSPAPNPYEAPPPAAPEPSQKPSGMDIS